MKRYEIVYSNTKPKDFTEFIKNRIPFIYNGGFVKYFDMNKSTLGQLYGIFIYIKNKN